MRNVLPWGGVLDSGPAHHVLVDHNPSEVLVVLDQECVGDRVVVLLIVASQESQPCHLSELDY